MEHWDSKAGQVGKELVESKSRGPRTNTKQIHTASSAYINTGAMRNATEKSSFHFAVLASSKTQEANKRRKILRGY